MRDDSYLQRESDAAEAKASAWHGRAATTAGALISLAILAIVVIWSYRLGVRDANDVPVIRAQTEATKIKPDDPGGIEIAHQNREVYNIVDGTSSSTDGAFAPSEETLTAADAPVSPSPAPRPAEVTETTVVPASPAAVEETAQAPVSAAPETVAEAEPATTAEVEAEPAQIAEDVSAVAPKAAPVALRRPARAAPKPQQASTLAEPRAAALASRIQIQLGAFNTEDIAASQWTELKNRNGDLLSGRARVVTPVVSGGRRLYRLRAGPFKDVDEASTLCRALKARGEDCIVARAK
ncbi:MAG: SPOR domain-containing protein [Paracoccaceae bacterium]|nr:SPOR domain-containing protein [Paracoccaceae bacterium]MDG1369752.1 SPOR domain-containing protein [Paracoccaceae bacterium]